MGKTEPKNCSSSLYSDLRIVVQIRKSQFSGNPKATS